MNFCLHKKNPFYEVLEYPQTGKKEHPLKAKIHGSVKDFHVFGRAYVHVYFARGQSPTFFLLLATLEPVCRPNPLGVPSKHPRIKDRLPITPTEKQAVHPG